MTQIKDSELMKKMMMFVRKTRRGLDGPGRDLPGGGRPEALPPHGPEMEMQHGGRGLRHPDGPEMDMQHGGKGRRYPDGPEMDMQHGGRGRRHPDGLEMDGHRPPEPPFGHGPHGMRHGMRRPPLSREHILIMIGEHPDGVRQKTIAEEAGINQSSASELISKLEADGYLRRTVDPDDRRATLLFLTDLGQARAAEVADEKEAVFTEFFSVLTEEEKDTLSSILDKLLES